MYYIIYIKKVNLFLFLVKKTNYRVYLFCLNCYQTTETHPNTPSKTYLTTVPIFSPLQIFIKLPFLFISKTRIGNLFS